MGVASTYLELDQSMKRFFSFLMTSFLALLLTACGGGGGSGGTTGPVGSTSVLTPTVLTAQLQDASGAAVSSIAADGTTFIVGRLTTRDGNPLAQQLIAIESDFNDRLVFPTGLSAKTDSNGLAKIAVRRVNLFEFGSDTAFLSFSTTGKYSFSLSSIFTVLVDPPILKMTLADSSGVAISAIPAEKPVDVIVTLKFNDGTPVKQKRIEVNGDLTKVSFPEGNSQLTDEAGVAKIKVARAPGATGGAGTLNAAATISGVGTKGDAINTVIVGKVDYSVGIASGVARLVLDKLDVGQATLPAYGTRQVSVGAFLGGDPARSVQVSFSSSCGQVSPANVVTNASGTATASFTSTDAAGVSPSTLGCGGKTVDISASAVGADIITKGISVSPAPATNLSYVVPADLTKARIYLANSGGPTQTTVEFLLRNSREEPLPNQDIRVSLKTLNAGLPKATLNTITNTDPVTLTTDGSGKISVPVFSGSVPTNVMINAALVANPSIQSDSSVIAIASGRPAQAQVSLSVAKFSLEGWNFDGDVSTVTLSLADRQGNPVPDGTAVNFVTTGGVMIPPVCVTGGVAGNSQCSVTIRTQNPRLQVPRVDKDGYVKILAYVAGEEDFVDANFNNVYDAGEPFTDLVTAYRDDNGNKVHDTGEFSVPRSGASTTSGDGVWGAADVRMESTMIFATSYAVFSNASASTAVVSVVVSDGNGNSMPTGSQITATGVDATSGNNISCTVVSGGLTTIPNTLDPIRVAVGLKDCEAGDSVFVEVKTPATSTVSPFAISIP